MEKFKGFLSHVVKSTKLKSQDFPLKITLGNVSADMDSVVGSMALAYYYFLKQDQYFVPVVNCRRQDIYLKLDIIKHFQNSNMSETEHVLYIEDLEPLD